MSQKALSRFLKGIILMVLAAAAVVYLLLLPSDTVPGYAGSEALAGVRTLLIWPTALPILAGLVCAWLVARNIGLDRSFSRANAKLLTIISVLAAVDGGYYFVVSLFLFLTGPGGPEALLAPAVLVVIAAASSVAAAALSHLVLKAAALQEQSDLTI